MTRSHSLAALAALAVLAATVACDHEFHPPDAEERAAQADSLFSPAAFDTVAWPDDEARSAAGNLVYAEKCRRCHGPVGLGRTDYARERDLTVPSLVEADWEYDDLGALRRRIFTGHSQGMPSWGVTTLSPRQIDAASFYLLRQLRPEVIGR